MAGELIGALRVALGFDTAEFTAGTKKAQAEAKRTATSIQGTFTGLKTAVTALATGAVATAVIGAAKRALDYASSLDEVSQQLGVTSRDLQVYRYAATQVGVSQEEMDKGLQKFTRTLGEARSGNASAIGTFRELGLSLEDIKHGDPHDVLLKTADGLAQIKDGANRAAPEVKLFGRAGQQLDTLLSGGSAAINDLARAAQSLGIVLSEDQIANADRTADKLSELKTVLEANISQVVADNASAIYDFANSLEKLISKVPAFLDGMRRLQANIGIAQGYGHMIVGSAFGGIPGTAVKEGAATVAAGQQQIRALNDARNKRMLAGLEPLQSTAPAPRGKNYTDPAARAAAAAAADKAAREAEKQRQEALRREDHFQTEKARSDDEFLGLRQQLTTDVRAQAMLQHEQIDRDVAAKARDLDLAVQENQISAANAAHLKVLDARNADLQHGIVNRELDAKLDQQSLDAQLADLSNRRDILSASSDLARTAKDRREIELKLLDLQFEEERARQEAILASKESTDAQKKIAQARLDTLPDLYSAGRASVERRNAGPGAQYLDGLIRSADEAQEALENVEVNGLKSLEDGLTGIVAGTESVGSAFSSMAKGIIADLARIAIQKSVIEPLASSLFGAAGGGLGGMFGGGGVPHMMSSSQVNSSLATMLPGFAPSVGSITGFATGGRFKVGGMGAADSKAFGLKLSPGEMVEVSKGDKPAAGNVHVHLNVQGGVDLATRSETYRLADAVRVAVKTELAQERRRSA